MGKPKVLYKVKDIAGKYYYCHMSPQQWSYMAGLKNVDCIGGEKGHEEKHVGRIERYESVKLFLKNADLSGPGHARRSPELVEPPQLPLEPKEHPALADKVLLLSRRFEGLETKRYDKSHSEQRTQAVTSLQELAADCFGEGKVDLSRDLMKIWRSAVRNSQLAAMTLRLLAESLRSKI